MKKTDLEDEIIADINMTPLIDIMLVLLIIFMVTSSVSLDSGLDIELPDSTSTSNERQDSSILVSIGKDRTLLINGTQTTFEQFEVDLRAVMDKEKSSVVIIEGDESSSLGVTVELMDAAKRAGASKFALATEEKSL